MTAISFKGYVFAVIQLEVSYEMMKIAFLETTSASMVPFECMLNVMYTHHNLHIYIYTQYVNV